MDFILCTLKFKSRNFHRLFVFSLFSTKNKATGPIYILQILKEALKHFQNVSITQQTTNVLNKILAKRHSQVVSTILVLEAVLMCARHVLYKTEGLTYLL